MTGRRSSGDRTGSLVLRDVEWEGRPGQVVGIIDGVVAYAGGAHGFDPSATGLQNARVLDGGGGALLPGLHDHHLHLLSTAAQARSVPCGPPAVADRSLLGHVLRVAAAGVPPGSWVRGHGYDDTLLGPIDGPTLDDLLGPFVDRAVRVQHRSGHQWVLNATAARQVEAAIGTRWLAPVARAAWRRGVATDLDQHLRAGWPVEAPPLDDVGRELARLGVTGVTDASVGNGPEELAVFEQAQRSGELPQRLLLLGGDLSERQGPWLRTGARKIVLAESTLPGLDELVEMIRAAGGRGVALHAVSREALVLAAVALARAGAGAGAGAGAASGAGPHRIEHASVAPPEVVDLLAPLGITVVTQPGFVAEHGDRYRREVAPEDQPYLYRLAGWCEAGVALAGSSDAPFGSLDPWAAMAAAVHRQTRAGVALGSAEALSPEAALALFLGPPEHPGGPPRRVAVGQPADLCLLRVGWADARRQLCRELVKATVIAGRVVWAS